MKSIVGLYKKDFKEYDFKSINDAEDFTNVSKNSIEKCLKGDIKSSCNWFFRYTGEDYSSKAKSFTDKRIKFYRLTKGDSVIELPLAMIENQLGISKSVIVEAERGYKKLPSGEKLKTQFAKGYKVEELKGEEKVQALSKINYIDYLKSFYTKVEKENNQSIGEGIVETILKENNIYYEPEKPIKNTRLLMDFYLLQDNKEYCIEYQGVHHFSDKYKTINTENRIQNDLKKKEYCLNNGITFIEIPYYLNIKEIIDLLSNFLPIQKIPKVYTLNGGLTINTEKFIEDYKILNREHMAKKYNTTQNVIKYILKYIGFNGKRNIEYSLGVIDNSTNTKVYEGSYYDVLKQFPSINQSDIPRVLRGERKSTGGYRLVKKE